MRVIRSRSDPIVHLQPLLELNRAQVAEPLVADHEALELLGGLARAAVVLATFLILVVSAPIKVQELVIVSDLVAV